MHYITETFDGSHLELWKNMKVRFNIFQDSNGFWAHVASIYIHKWFLVY